MKKHAPRLVLVLLFSIAANLVLAQKKALEPKTGSIFLVNEVKITDSVSFNESFHAFIENFMKGVKAKIINEYGSYNETIDTLRLNEIAEMMKSTLFATMGKPGKIRQLIEYKNDKIFYVQLNSSGINNELYYYDRRTDKVVNSYDKSTLGDYFDGEQIISVKEHRKETKNIEGYNCFKVVYRYQEKSEKSEPFMPAIFYTRKLWVTDELRSSFHPVVKSRKILSKYFPLEIIESIGDVKGIETVYMSESIDLR